MPSPRLGKCVDVKIAIASQTSNPVKIICQLLFPWKVSFTSADEADILVVYGKKPPDGMQAIVIPSDSFAFSDWLKDRGTQYSKKAGKRTTVMATQQTALTIVPEAHFYYGGSNESISSVSQPPMIKLQDDCILLPIDIIEEYQRVVNEALDPKSSRLYGLLTRLPIPYGLAPRRLRNLLIRCKDQQMILYSEKIPIDALRFLLAGAIEELSNRKLERRRWNGQNYACAVTHDVETHNGLRKATSIKKVEENYDIPSAWYLPSKRFELERETISALAQFGEVGAHDTKHDGKLHRLAKQELIRRLSEAKQTLQELAACPVTGLRTPLLQQNWTILRGLRDAGYSYDSSIPTWEPKHPQTMSSYGLGTTFPVVLDATTEIPVSVIQDHQLLYALGLEPKEAIATWLSIINVIKELGGCCVLLSHPDYKLFDKNNIIIYEELLNTLASDEEISFTTPKHLANAATD